MKECKIKCTGYPEMCTPQKCNWYPELRQTIPVPQPEPDLLTEFTENDFIIRLCTIINQQEILVSRGIPYSPRQKAELIVTDAKDMGWKSPEQFAKCQQEIDRLKSIGIDLRSEVVVAHREANKYEARIKELEAHAGGGKAVRILGFTKKWEKLSQNTFTSFRYPRKDSDKGRDWHNGEILKIVFQPRHQNEYLGVARVISKVSKHVFEITKEEAIADGFTSYAEMMAFLKAGEPNVVINKLTLEWISK